MYSKKIKFLQQILFLGVILLNSQSCQEANSETLIEVANATITTRGAVHSAIETQDWQAALADTTHVAKVLLPGTHDAGAYMTGGSLILTQSLTIQEQLQAGVRVFDIRLRAVDNERLEIYHGISAQGLYFQEDILQVCIDFLQAHPAEFLVFSLKKEGENVNSTKGYQGLLREILAKPSYTSFFAAHFRKDLRVKELRGKILLLHRDFIGQEAPGAYFQGWKDDASFQARLVDNSTAKIAKVFIEDNYKVPTLFNIDQKWEAIQQNLVLSANSNSPDDWFISFASGTSAFVHPVTVARKINPKLEEFLQQENQSYRGILFMDFVTHKESLMQQIIQNNFN